MLRWLVSACRTVAGSMDLSGVGRGTEIGRLETQQLVKSKQNLVDMQADHAATPEARKEATLNVLDTVAKLHRNDLLSPEDRQFIVSLHAATAGGGQPTVEQIGKLAQIVEGLRAKLHGPEEVSPVHEAPAIDDAQVEELAKGFREQLEAIVSAPDYKEAKRLNHELHQQMDQLLEANPELYERVHVALEPDLAVARGHIRSIHQASAMELHQAKARHETELAMVELTLTDPDLNDAERTAWGNKRERLLKAIESDNEQLAELDRQQAGPLDNRSAAELQADNERIKGEAQDLVRSQPDMKAMLDVIDKARSDGKDGAPQAKSGQGVAAAAAKAMGFGGQAPPPHMLDPTIAPGHSGAQFWDHMINALSNSMIMNNQTRVDSAQKEMADEAVEKSHLEKMEKHASVAEIHDQQHAQEQKALEHEEHKSQLDALSDQAAAQRKQDAHLQEKSMIQQVEDEVRGRGDT